MSRTVRGSKPAGYDYWSRRPFSARSYGPEVKRICHRLERIQGKEQIRGELNPPNDLCFNKEIDFLCKKYGVEFKDAEIDAEHPCGEICIFIKGKWYGYIDWLFYLEMEQGITEEEYTEEMYYVWEDYKAK
jgi:hypothetical protein